MSAPRLLALTGGHRVDRDAFEAMLAAVCGERGWVFSHAVQPAAQRWLAPELAGSYDAVLCHDIPGLVLKRGTPPTAVAPEPQVARDLAGVLDAGKGFVFLHHALAGWPAWPGWAEVLGGRYHYAPGRLRGEDWPDSGYRYADYTARVVAPEHPVCAGLAELKLQDELYCCPVFESEVVPLLRAEADPSSAGYRETYAEVLGEGGGEWRHPPASDLVAWAKTAGRSPVVYVQPGDGAATFAHPGFRRLLGNAIDWVASTQARDWAAAHPADIHLDVGSTEWT